MQQPASTATQVTLLVNMWLAQPDARIPEDPTVAKLCPQILRITFNSAYGQICQTNHTSSSHYSAERVMDKVWFKLRHTHNPAPDVTTLGTSTETGPILLGQFIPDLNHLDQVINRGDIRPFPGDMKVWPSQTIRFRWDDSRSTQAGVSGSARAPAAAAAAGVDIQATASGAFRQSVDNYSEFESLDCYIVNPVKSYINEYLTGGSVAEHVKYDKTLGTWKLFIITGIMIARGAKTSNKEGVYKEGHATSGLSVPDVVGVNVEGNLMNDRKQASSGSSVTDFVWAIRLAKLSKTLGQVILQRDWSMITETEGATFASGDDEVDVTDVVAREGMEEIGPVVEDEELELAFVLN
ncbi:hypothetical protein N0V84_007480 [Fusarium piperis]|uniref:Uncharacterized protein n=1 Tax=Fusarium piperis TaxID=1435070 RepID=A0A9W8WA10_9HYPO|nr:hypothetical protein N0V84_007480 [Fusarium piperis]